MSRLHPHIISIIEETGEADAESAIRSKARSLVRRYVEHFGGTPPFNLKAMASFCGLHESTEAPRHSADSEIAPESDGRVVLRVNRDRPQTRQRFSIGHEIGHTLFPEYKLQVRCRKAHDRDWADPNDLLETLCDVAASELLFPEPWFRETVAKMSLSADAIVSLAAAYEASRDSTVRRLVEVYEQPLAAVFLTWKLKPTEIRQAANDRIQRRMFEDDQLPEPQPKLRVDYAIVNNGFAQKCCDHIPKDKSIPCEGPIHQSSLTQEPCDGAMYLDFGTVQREFTVNVIPIYTSELSLGPDGSVSVVAVLHPGPR